MDPDEIHGSFPPSSGFLTWWWLAARSVRAGDEHDFHAMRGRQKGSPGHQSYFTSLFQCLYSKIGDLS